MILDQCKFLTRDDNDDDDDNDHVALVVICVYWKNPKYYSGHTRRQTTIVKEYGEEQHI